MPSLMGLRSNASMTPLHDDLTGTGQFMFKAPNSNAGFEMERGNGAWNSYGYNSKETRSHRVAIMGKSVSGDNNSEEQLRGVEAESGDDVSYKVMRATAHHV